MLKKLLLIAAFALVLSPMAQARDVTESGVDAASSGTSSSITGSQTPQAKSSGDTGTTPQTCTASCNRSYEGCMDQQSAISGDGDTLRYGNNVADKLIGTSSDCSDHLRNCLNTCGG